MGFSAIDYVVLFVYLIGITIFGTLFRKSNRSVRDYFVGARKTHWFVISLSIVATETSTLTMIGVPALAYTVYARPEQGGTLTYLQVVIGYVIARVIISFLFIPAYFQGDLLTAYELLSRRFGAATKHFAASLFVVMRALADGVRVFAASLVLAAILGSSLPGLPHLWLWSIVLVGVLTLIYTFEGGIAAVIWTDLIQLIIYVAGSLLAAWLLLEAVPGGWPTIAAEAGAANKFQWLSFSWDPTVPFTFWAGLIGGTFLTMASHGTDQLLVQRLFACRNQRDSQKALIASGFIVLAQFALFLTIGVMLYVYYRHVPVPRIIEQRRDLPGVHREQPAEGRRRPGHRRDLRRRDVDVERLAELAGVRRRCSTSTNRSPARARPTLTCSACRAGARRPGAWCSWPSLSSPAIGARCSRPDCRSRRSSTARCSAPSCWAS